MDITGMNPEEKRCFFGKEFFRGKRSGIFSKGEELIFWWMKDSMILMIVLLDFKHI